MKSGNSRFLRHLILSVVFVLCGSTALRFTGFSSTQRADGTAIIMGAVLCILTALAAATKEKDEPGHIKASRLLAMSCATLAAGFAATRQSGHAVFFLCGLLQCIPFVVYALRKDLDDFVSPLFLLFASIVQMALVAFIIS